MELTVGIWSNKKLAEWFGIKANTLSHSKEKRLKELEEYAVFEILKTGKIRIIEVKTAFYRNQKTYDYYKKKVPKAWRYN